MDLRAIKPSRKPYSSRHIDPARQRNAETHVAPEPVAAQRTDRRRAGAASARRDADAGLTGAIGAQWNHLAGPRLGNR